MEPSWDIGDGFFRWSRGVSQTRFLITLIRPEVIAYISGCHVKFAKLTQPTSTVFRMFHPGLEGIELLEGCPIKGIFALAERARFPRIHVYRFENDKDHLVAELKGGAENRYRAIRFNSSDLLLALSGVPELQIFVWRWESGEQLMSINCLEKGYESDLLISGVRDEVWVEWSSAYLTFYELQVFRSELSVVRTEVSLPPNETSLSAPDPDCGNKYSMRLISLAFDSGGGLWAMGHTNTLYYISSEEKILNLVGEVDLSEEKEGSMIEKIVAYDNSIAAILSTGTFLVLQIAKNNIRIKSRLEFSSKISMYISNSTSNHPQTSFYALTQNEKRIENVLDGKLRAPYTLLDLLLSEIQSFCFIEREAAFVGLVTERGAVYVLDAERGNIHVKWKLPFFAESITTHPLLPIVAIGTPDGCVNFLDIRNIKSPQMLHRNFISQDTEMDRLVWTCRGRFLLAGDARRHHLFLMYGLPSMEFSYLDYSSLPGQIRSINVPGSYKDKRVQVLCQLGEKDEVPFQLNNYKLDGDSLELVASQLLDCPIKTITFSTFKKLLYVYSCSAHSIGMSPFTEDLQAGSLKEPEILFHGDLPLHVNRLILLGDKLYSFGEDGYGMEHSLPSPKTVELSTLAVFQTHFPSYEGIKDGILSTNGCHLLAIGFDNSLVHLRLKADVDMLSWSHLGFGSDTARVIECQMKYFKTIKAHKDYEIYEEEEDLYTQAVYNERSYLFRRSESEVGGVREGLKNLKKKLHELMERNGKKIEVERVDIEEFELDEDHEETELKEIEMDKQILDIVLRTKIEERDKWCALMKKTLWEPYETKTCRIKAFCESREVCNYVLVKEDENFGKELRIKVNERRVDRKLDEFGDELKKYRHSAIAKVLELKKKHRVKGRKVDLSKYPPRVRDEMKKIMGRGGSNSDSDDESLLSEDEGSKESSLSFSEFDARNDDNNGDESGIENDMDNESVVGSGKENAHEEENETKNEEEEGDGEEGNEEEEGGEEECDREKEECPPLETEVQNEEEGENENEDENEEEEEGEEGGDEEEDDDEDLDEFEGGGGDDKIEEELDVESESSDDDEEEEGDGERVREKKRIMVLKKLTEDEEDDRKIWVEVDDSSDESEEEVQRDIEREERRSRRKLRKMEEGERERRAYVAQLYSGSLYHEFFNASTLLYDQLDLIAIHEMHTQARVIQHEIRRLKVLFNESFDEVRKMKLSEMESLKERNSRIREIADYFGIIIEVDDPHLVDYEDPASVFIVRDEEIWFPKYMTEDERREAELARLRGLRTKDEFYERALIKMMDGVLESQREALLKRDIPKPGFMLYKERWEWTPDELTKAQDYFRKCEELEKMREEYRKETERELRALLKTNIKSQQQFDGELKKLQELKFRVEMCIEIEEVKLCRIMRHIMKRFEIEKEEHRQASTLKKLQESMKATHAFASELAARADDSSIRFGILEEKERALERTFRIDLGDVGHFYDAFLRLYKKRPKLVIKGEKSSEVLKLMIKILSAPNLSIAQSELPPSAQFIFDAIYDLDDPMQNPVGCPRSTWDKFCRLRHERIICEYEQKVIGSELMSLRQVLVTFKGREMEGQSGIASILATLSRVRDQKLAHVHNAEFQMVISQAQIELPRALVRSDFYDAFLLKKSLVQSCNAYIRKFGDMKEGELVKTKKLHKIVKQLEWKFKVVQLEEKHGLILIKDINRLKLSKEVMEYLRHTDDFRSVQSRKLESIRKLEREVKKFHERIMRRQNRILNKFEKSVEGVEENTALKEEMVQDKNIGISELLTQCDVMDPKETAQIHEQRVKIIMNSGAIMRRIAQNAEEINCLETELDRLYKRTFPML